MSYDSYFWFLSMNIYEWAFFFANAKLSGQSQAIQTKTKNKLCYYTP